jgi:hypothetical protein
MATVYITGAIVVCIGAHPPCCMVMGILDSQSPPSPHVQTNGGFGNEEELQVEEQEKVIEQ